MSKLGHAVSKGIQWGARLNERAGVGWLENKVAGKGTQNTLASQVLDPFRKARSNQAAGASIGPADVFDPNAKLHQASTNTDENVQAQQDQEAAAAEAARIRAIAPSEDSTAITAAKRRSLLRQQGRTGRSSTILTGGATDTLG